MEPARRIAVSVLAAVAVCAVAACGPPDDPGSAHREAPAASGAVTPVPAPASLPRVVVLGDSLTAGLGLPPDQAYPALLQARLKNEGLRYEVVNAGVSGDTSAGGLSRVDWALDGDVRVLIVALGGNDGLRGLPPSELRKNLGAIIERAQGRGIAVVLAGMEAPPNYGRDYTAAFRKVYPDLARAYHVTLLPFLLAGVAGHETLNQADGIHPTAAGARIVADNVWTVLRPLVEKRSTS